MGVAAQAPASPHPGMGFKQFVALVAALMASNALAIDSMLPALPQIGHALGLTSDNQRQWIITGYLLGFGVAQIVYGTLGDRYGRKRLLLIGTAIYTVSSIVAAFSGSFEMMMIARVTQGIGAAATRVLSVAVVRDCYSGRQMARVMSLAMVVFLVVPIVAPSIGQAIILVAPWPWIFGVLAIFGSVLLVWVTLRLPETLHPQNRLPIRFGRVARAFGATLSNRHAVGYMMAMCLVLGGLFGFINSAQQVFVEVFDVGLFFPTLFALIAGAMAVASVVNARIVGRIGMRRVSHAALLGYMVIVLTHAAVALAGLETIYSFTLLQAAMMFCFGLMAPNFGAMAMEPLGHVAGTAASVQGFVTTVGGALLGFYVGQHYDGTVVPLTLGFAGFGLLAFGVVLLTERGKLFRPSLAPAR
jgi:DHA1 family bicyclomycin/chloramphenicol resistance-like MFS transporter